MAPHSPMLWQEAYHVLRPKDQIVIPSTFTTKPQVLTDEIETYISQSKGTPIKLPNGEKLFVRDVLQKVSRWIKKFVEVGDVAVQYDPGHAALPWALLRLVLQMSMNNIEKHAAVLEGVEKVSYYLVWSRIEEACLTIPFDSHDQLRHAFVQLYAAILTFTARSLRFLRDKPKRIATAFFSSDSKFHKDLEQMVGQKQCIETYVQQITNLTNQKQYAEVLLVKAQLADLQQPMVRMEQIIQSTSTAVDRNERQHILDWASQIPFQKHFNTVRDKALAGTGQWLFHDLEFAAWENGSRSQILWLHGSAGSGKSTLISVFIQSLIKAHEERQSPYPIYFFCSRNPAEPERANPDHILRSLMRQTSDLPGGPRLHHNLEERFHRRRAEGEVSAKEACEIIINTIESRPITYIVIDALDECDRRKRDILVDALKTILTESNSLVKIFVTSRDNHADITWSMDGFPAVCIDASRNQTDIAQYVQHSVQRAINTKKLLPTEHVTADVQRAIVDNLCNGADGMFRWVELQLEFLYTLRKRSILLKRLKSLPPGLQKIYEELYVYNMQELGDEQAEVVKKILSWLLVAKAPLRPSEMCQLVCAPEEADMSVDTVLEMTFDLVRFDNEQDQFRFSHLSVREFLEKRSSDFELASLHSLATRACLSLLTSLETIDAEDYAALYWPAHAEDMNRAGGDKTTEQQLEVFLTTQNKHFTRWNDVMFRARKAKDYWDNLPIGQKLSGALVAAASPLLIAACFALPTQLRRIILDTKQPINTELENERGERALYLVAENGFTEGAQMLLENGADVNALGGGARTALQIATANGHIEIVKLLLERDADVNTRAGSGKTALLIASANGHVEIVKLLLERDADVNTRAGRGETALLIASANGHVEIVKLLLERDADVNTRAGRGETALLVASTKGHVEIVKLLLERDADVHALGGIYGEMPLYGASANGHVEVVRLLLERDADVNSIGCGVEPETALHIASANGHVEVVRLLLERDANVHALSGLFQETALYVASSKGHVEVVKLLLEEGADVNAVGGIYGTALCTASFQGRAEIVKLLLEKDADINAMGGIHGTALEAASANDHTEIVTLLRDR